MRNLKKVLSLALAMVMLLGMMVVGAGATSFTDDADITHQEAVTVVSGMEILTGVGDNTFNPKGTLSRAEAAVVIAKLDLGAAFGNLATTNASTFKDVGAGYGWAKPYIDYCAARGLIAGDGNGYFMPADKVTGVQFALMVARVLGYEDDNEDIGGADWEVNAAALARKAGLTIDVELGSNAIPRDDMAQVAFNALQADMVEYKQSAITIGNVTIPAGKASPVENNDGADKHYDNNADKKLQLCEEKFPTLKVNKSSTDSFGRPAARWAYKGKEVGRFANSASATYTDKVKIKDIYADLDLSESKSATVILDGVAQSPVSLTKNGGNLANSGKGVLVEAYKDSDDNVKICIINTYAGKVSRVTPAKDGNARYITITGAGNYETEGFAKDDIVLYTKAGSDIKTVTLAEKVENQKLTGFTGQGTTSNAASKLTVGGTAYDVSAQGTHKENIAIDSSYDLYLDNYGYVIYTELYEAGDSNYAYVLDTKSNGGYTEGATYNALLLLADGTTVDVLTDQNYASNKNDVVTYTVNSDDEYELTKKTDGVVAAFTDANNKTEVSVTLKPNTAKINVSSVTTTTGTAASPVASTINANSSTVFVVGNRASASDKYTYNVYTGIANVPKIDNAQVSAIAASDGTIAKYVFIQALDASISSSDSEKVIFIKGATKTAADKLTGSDKTEYYEYTAMIDGEETTLKVKDGATISGTGTTDLTANVWVKKISENKDGYITAVEAYPNTGAADVAQIKRSTGSELDGDAVRMGYNSGDWFTLDKDAPVVVVDGNDIYAGSVDEVDNSASDAIVAVVKDGKITAMAIVRQSVAAPGATITDNAGTITFEATDRDADVEIPVGDATSVVTLKVTTSAAGTASYKWEIVGTKPADVTFTAGTAATQTITLGGTTAYDVTVKVTVRDTLADGQYAESTDFVTMHVTKGS